MIILFSYFHLSGGNNSIFNLYIAWEIIRRYYSSNISANKENIITGIYANEHSISINMK